MKFGMMYLIQIPEPHYPGIGHDVYKGILAQAELADEVGFHYFWTAEHHFLKEFSQCSAPEVLYGAISQRTKRIRIGHAVALLPKQYNHAIRVAERIAVLDILSDGRMDLGTGRSATPIEMYGFEIDPDDTRPMWEEAMTMIPRMWMEDPFSYEGKYYNIPSRSIVPKPVQKPHPPLWMAAASPDSFRIAGEMGLGVLCFNFLGAELLAERIATYREAIQHARPVGAFINNQVAALAVVHCAESDEKALKIGEPPAMWFIRKSQELYTDWQKPGATVPESYKAGLQRTTTQRAEREFEDYVNSGAFVIGNPDTCIRALKRHQEAGVDQVLCFMDPGGMPHQEIMGSIKLFGQHIIPCFQ